MSLTKHRTMSIQSMTVEERIAFAAAKNEEFLNQEPQKVLEYFLNEIGRVPGDIRIVLKPQL